MKKTLALVLAVLLLVSMLAACTDEKKEAEQTEQTAATAVQTTPAGTQTTVPVADSSDGDLEAEFTYPVTDGDLDEFTYPVTDGDIA